MTAVGGASQARAPYVALGDSYAAGVGAGTGRGSCWRTIVAYPVSVADQLDVEVAQQACIGATVPDVERRQLGALGGDTAYVSITVGGNDVGFVPVLVACAEPAWMSGSDAVIDAALRVLREVLPGRLDRLYAAVTRRAPRADVVVTSYPVLLDGPDCNLATFFSPHEVARLAAATDELAGVVAAAAARAGVGFVDVREAFTGHAVCSPSEWVNGVSWPLEESFHPNGRGHAAYGRLVGPALGAVAGAGPRPGAGAPRRPLTEAAVVDGPGERGAAPVFALPDLLGERSLRGAAAHGLDPDEVAGLATTARQRLVSPGAAAAAWASLHALDAAVRTAAAGGSVSG